MARAQEPVLLSVALHFEAVAEHMRRGGTELFVHYSAVSQKVGFFLQHMGRTGRCKARTATTTFFCETTEGVLQAAALIELAKAGWVESIEVDGRC
jgi:ATP-dependent Lhr-like helicase